MGKSRTPTIEKFTAAETSALADLPAHMAAVARSSTQRSAAIVAAQYADHAASEEGKAELENLRQAAIEADGLIRTPGAGRPAISEARRTFRDTAESMEESPDRYRHTLAAYTRLIADLRDADGTVQEVQVQATAHAKACQETVELLERAGEVYTTCQTIAESGKATLAGLTNLVAFDSSPFIDLQQSSNSVRDLARRWRLRLDAELARIGVDPDDAQREQLERAEASQYTVDLAVACAAYRKTSDGALAWGQYQRATKQLSAAQAEQPQSDHGRLRDFAQHNLCDFYRGATEVAGLQFNPAAVPVV